MSTFVLLVVVRGAVRACFCSRSEPVDSQAPQAARMMYELRQLGHLLCVGWEHAQYADDDEAILEEAIPDGARLTGPDLAQLQRWRREHGLVWVSELLGCDGLTPLASTMAAKVGASETLRVLVDRTIAGPARVRQCPKQNLVVN